MEPNASVDLYRPLLAAICSGLGDIDFDRSWARFVERAPEEPENLYSAFIFHLIEGGRSGATEGAEKVAIDLDMRESDSEFVGQANLLLARHGVQEKFDWRFYDPSGYKKEIGFHALNEFVRPHGLTVISMSSDGDYYLAVLINTKDVEQFLATGPQLPSPAWTYDSWQPFCEVPDDWKEDDEPGRPPIWTDPIYRLHWRAPGHDSHFAGWSIEFADETLQQIGSEEIVKELEAQYLSQHPDHETRVQEVPVLQVSQGVPPTWFVAMVEQSNRGFFRAKTRRQFVAHHPPLKRAEDSYLTAHLGEATAWRSWIIAADRDRVKRSSVPISRVITVAEASDGNV